MIKRSSIVFLVIIAILFSCSMPSTISVKVQKPATIHMPSVKEIAIVDLLGQKRSGSQVATLTQSMLMATQHFDIMERDKLRRVLEEQNLGMAGVVDEATATEVGKLLGVDALIFGEVATYEVEPDKKITEKVKEKRGTGKYHMVEEKDKKGNVKKVRKEIIEEVWVDKSYWVRKGTVAINFRVVSVETGKLLAAHSDSKSYDSGKEQKRYLRYTVNQQKSLKPEGEILSDLSNAICQKFVQMIAPYYTNEKRIIESGKGNIKVGMKYAESGLWPEAMEAWKQAAREIPQEPAVFYNLGLGFEIQGELDKAEISYQEAVRLKQKKLYMDAVARIRKVKEEQKMLKEQLRERY